MVIKKEEKLSDYRSRKPQFCEEKGTNLREGKPRKWSMSLTSSNSFILPTSASIVRVPPRTDDVGCEVTDTAKEKDSKMSRGICHEVEKVFLSVILCLSSVEGGFESRLWVVGRESGWWVGCWIDQL